MAAMNQKTAKIISEHAQTLNSHVKMQNASLNPTNVMERMTVVTEAMNITVVSAKSFDYNILKPILKALCFSYTLYYLFLTS